MRPEGYQLLAQRQRTYWWHRGRRAMALSLLRRYGLETRPRWIDVGCGPGGNLHFLDAVQPSLTVGVDLSPTALDFAAKNAPNATLVRADINEALPFSDGYFDVATVFNVLYHEWVTSEAKVLAEIARIVRPGGLLLLTEPAFNSLRRELDDVVMTRRRYHLDDFRPWFAAARFAPLFGSYFTSFGFPLLLTAKAFRSRTNSHREQASPDMKPLLAPVNNAFLGAAMLENLALSRGVRMPFGTTLVWIAQRNL